MKRLSTLVALLGLMSVPAYATDPIQIGARHELFIDDYLVERIDGLTRTLHQPTDIADNPVIAPNNPWEHRRIPFGSVCYVPDEEMFKCWYLTMNIYDSRPGFRGYRKKHHLPIHEAAYICYAESKDGVHWRKPNLGLHEFRGSKKNNIVLTCPGTHFDSTSVMMVPGDELPYRMMTFIGRWPYRKDLVKKQWGDPSPFDITQHGHYGFGSKDGIHWQELNGNQPVLKASDRSMFWWDPTRGIYAGAIKSSFKGKRAQLYGHSPDMINWTRTSQWIHLADEHDHPRDEGEAIYGFPYGSQWIGFAEMRRIRKGRPVKINWELVTSRDGRRWSRPFRECFFADAGPKTWRYQVLKIFANPPIERDGKLLIYYGGKTGTVAIEKGNEPFQALCVAELRKDGFVSLDADKSGGELVTKPFVASGKTLMLNLSAAGNGQARVEVLGEDEATRPAFSLNHCIPLRGDETEQAVSWQNGGDWRQLSGQTIRLRIQLTNAALFALWARP